MFQNANLIEIHSRLLTFHLILMTILLELYTSSAHVLKSQSPAICRLGDKCEGGVMVARTVLAFDSEALLVSANPNGGPALGSSIINNSSTPDGTVFTYQPGFGAAVVTIDDTNVGAAADVFDDDDTGNHTVTDGAGLVANGQSVESESLIQIQALDANGNLTGPVIDIYVFSQGGNFSDVWGFATDSTLTAGTQYQKVAGSNNGDSLYVDFVCFVRDALIRTPQGAVPVQDIMVGDRVWTKSNPEAVVRWVGSKTIYATGPTAPVVFEVGAIGNTTPLVVSQQHRVLVRNAEAVLMFGAEEVLVPALSLVALDGVRIAEGGVVTYHHIMFDDHKIIESDGVLTESFHPGPTAMDTLDQAAQEELTRLFPDLVERAHFGPTAGYSLKAFEAETLASTMC